MKKYLAEALGTGVLALVVGLSLSGGVGAFPLSTAVLAALTVGFFVYSIGQISGAHLNPAVTVGAWAIGKIESNEAFKYITAQVMGAVVALATLQALTVAPVVSAGAGALTGAAEFLGTFILTFGIASVVFGKVSSQLSGVVIGGALLLGIALSALLGANGVLNPAVAFVIGSFNFMYLVGPVLGGVAGMALCRFLYKI